MKLTTKEIVEEAQPAKPCHCGSGLERWKLWNVDGYVMDSYCPKCEASVKRRYRPETYRD